MMAFMNPTEAPTPSLEDRLEVPESSEPHDRNAFLISPTPFKSREDKIDPGSQCDFNNLGQVRRSEYIPRLLPEQPSDHA